ncbi:MAG: ferrous iron transport protein B [Candidatus Mcinerneyibacterium aminivorans]|uniref:Ferrous iron transport protein B n=1 Tax=Candidatus Mcinerneyibacterium aminivorans TaxID=2703815 RepID=A0A5D0MBT0_9BACT|nr:MAG: ferrous iron transport protein B [Candidatus Mcinerneyibacterium aminivorans]
MLVAVVGNPNVGKTAILNKVAGQNLKVGNWAGVTVEKKEAVIEFNGTKIRLVDLPGIYSLSPYSMEENIARDFLIEEKPDFIVNVIDSTNLERNLYLTTQLMELEIPMVIALNMWDEFEKKGYDIDLELFRELLGIDVIPTVGRNGKGVDELFKTGMNAKVPGVIRYNRKVETYIQDSIDYLSSYEDKLDVDPRWYAIKLLEGDNHTLERFESEKLVKHFDKRREELKNYFKEDVESVISDQRYGHISGILKEILTLPPMDKKELTDKIDSVVLNRILGLPIFFGLIYLVFKFTFEGSAPFITWIEGFINNFIGKWILIGLESISSPDWFTSIVNEGIIGGVGSVLVFIPLLFFLFLFLAILEESGYMSRAAFVMDRIMRSIGLPGKAFVPLLIGFGCNVPAIYATRTLENDTDRKLTALIIPFMSCGARLPVYILFTAVFFRTNQTNIIFSLYLLGIATAVLIGYLLRKTIFKGKEHQLIMELPPYRIPSLKMIWDSIWMRLREFVKKAGTVILAAMILLWVVMNIPYGAKTEDTAYYKVSKTITPIYKPLGFGEPKPVAALIPGMIAKEIVVGSLGQLYKAEGSSEDRDKIRERNILKDAGKQVVGFKDAFFESIEGMFGGLSMGATFSVQEHEETALTRKLRDEFTPLSAYSYMVYILLFIPCVVVMGAIYQEFGPRILMMSIGLTLVAPWIVSFIIYNFGLLFGLG